MLWNLLLLALIGLLAGTAARMLYPGRSRMGIPATMALGMVGSLLGGLFSWPLWPAAVDPFHLAGLLTSSLWALIVLYVCAGYARRSRA